jgi:hypothetical protein
MVLVFAERLLQVLVECVAARVRMRVCHFCTGDPPEFIGVRAEWRGVARVRRGGPIADFAVSFDHGSVSSCRSDEAADASAVDSPDGGGDEAGRVAGQEHDDVRDLRGVTEAS